jgi:hypothetical protein
MRWVKSLRCSGGGSCNPCTMSFLMRRSRDVIRRKYNFFQSSSQRGSFSFNGQFTSQIGVGNTRSGMGDFLLGLPSISALTVLLSEVGQRQIEAGLVCAG